MNLESLPMAIVSAGIPLVEYRDGRLMTVVSDPDNSREPLAVLANLMRPEPRCPTACDCPWRRWERIGRYLGLPERDLGVAIIAFHYRPDSWVPHAGKYARDVPGVARLRLSLELLSRDPLAAV